MNMSKKPSYSVCHYVCDETLKKTLFLEKVSLGHLTEMEQRLYFLHESTNNENESFYANILKNIKTDYSGDNYCLEFI